MNFFLKMRNYTSIGLMTDLTLFIFLPIYIYYNL